MNHFRLLFISILFSAWACGKKLLNGLKKLMPHMMLRWCITPGLLYRKIIQTIRH